jgi:hypothetical protein
MFLLGNTLLYPFSTAQRVLEQIRYQYCGQLASITRYKIRREELGGARCLVLLFVVETGVFSTLRLHGADQFPILLPGAFGGNFFTHSLD